MHASLSIAVRYSVQLRPCVNIGKFVKQLVAWMQKYAINQVGFGYTHRPDINQPIMQPNVQVMLDYRCHVEDGTLGTEYPPKMKECMTRLTQMSLTEIQQHYRFPDTKFGQVYC